MKRETKEQKKVFGTHISDNCRIYNDLWQLKSKQPYFLMDKTLKQTFRKRRYSNGQSAYLERSKLLAIRHMKIKTTVTCQYTPTRIVKRKRWYIASGTIKWYDFRKLAVSYKDTMYVSILLLSSFTSRYLSKRSENIVHKMLSSKMFVAALFIIA